MIRIQKFLAECGLCSRRKAEQYILSGKVKINGKIITDLAFKIDPNKDTVYFENKKIQNQENKIYIMLNKPKGCVTTVKDQFSRKTVFDYINIKERIVPVGRLDYNTKGLLILTNDGDLTYKLTHPKHNIKKVYIAKVSGNLTENKIKSFKEGLIIDNYKTKKADIQILEKNKNIYTLKITIYEGRNRQIRKMCQKIGLNVLTLERIAIQDLKIEGLKRGEFRFLSQKEILYLKNIASL